SCSIASCRTPPRTISPTGRAACSISPITASATAITAPITTGTSTNRFRPTSIACRGANTCFAYEARLSQQAPGGDNGRDQCKRSDSQYKHACTRAIVIAGRRNGGAARRRRRRLGRRLSLRLLRHGRRLAALADRHVGPLGGAGVELARTADLLCGVFDHFLPLRDTADRAREREDGREHRRWGRASSG